MKKIIVAAIVVMTFGFTNAQDGHFKVGTHVGVSIGNSSVNLGFNYKF